MQNPQSNSPSTSPDSVDLIHSTPVST